MIVSGLRFVQGRNAYVDADGRKYGVAIHATANDATAQAEAAYASRRTDGVSSHFFVDGDSVIQSLDTGSRAGHAGSPEGNDNAICFELVGSNDKSRGWWLANICWDQLAGVIVELIAAGVLEPGFEVRRAFAAEMRANPTVGAFYGHNDMRLAWGGTTHTDPGPNFPWDRLIAAVDAALEARMALPDDDVARIAEATARQVWAYMIRSGSLDLDTAAMNWVKKAEQSRRELSGKVDALAADVAALSVGGVDVDVLAEAVADKMAARMQD